MDLLLALALAASAPPPAAVDDAILHYVRSNRDGSEPEHIVHFRPTPTEVAVYKWVSKCTTAAYVTAEMDTASWEARRLYAGKVGRDGKQERFGTLTLDPASRTLSLVADVPEGRIEDQTQVPDGPWYLFDYDFGDLNAALQERKPRGDFAFTLALVWPEGGDLFSTMGGVQATYRGRERHLGRSTERFDLTLTGPRPATGRLWIDAEANHIVDSWLSLPNHEGYDDFRLRLERVERGGQPAWDALLKGHYADCPTGN